MHRCGRLAPALAFFKERRDGHLALLPFRGALRRRIPFFKMFRHQKFLPLPLGGFWSVLAPFISSCVTRQSPFLSNRKINSLGLFTNSLRVIFPSWFSSK